MELQIPPEVDAVRQALTRSGYEAYAVGGCVRDSLLGLAPHDWDLTTSARPEQARRALSAFKVIDTGLKHGTVTALSGKTAVEVTSYRVDGPYSDGRHPDRVAFTASLKEDLARRDFTVNALAYSPETGVVDCFGGMKDLAEKRIRCVGDADRRFREDGLRILRAMRFSADLGFSIEQETARSLLRSRALLDRIARERIRAEFTKLLCGAQAAAVLRKFRDAAAQFIPELRPCFGFAQRNPHHVYDVWEHTLHTVDAAPQEPVLRLTMLLHDIGKPLCFSVGRDGVGHFYGHAGKSAELAEKILRRLRYDNRTVADVATLVRWHGVPLPPDERFLRRRLGQLGERNLHRLFRVQAADTLGKSPADRGRLEELCRAEAMLDALLARGDCFSLKSLAVNGNDLLRAGVPEGAAVGKTLRALLAAVMDGKCPNSRAELLRYAAALKGSEKA